MSHGGVSLRQRLTARIGALTAPIAVVALMLGSSVGAVAADRPASAPPTASRAAADAGLGPHIEPARGGSCVAAAPVMRREHMRLLRHQRDDTVRAGRRGGTASLRGCVECHASRASGSVANTPTDFCVSCHAYAGVRIDCFECHASRP